MTAKVVSLDDNGECAQEVPAVPIVEIDG